MAFSPRFDSARKAYTSVKWSEMSPRSSMQMKQTALSNVSNDKVFGYKRPRDAEGAGISMFSSDQLQNSHTFILLVRLCLLLSMSLWVMLSCDIALGAGSSAQSVREWARLRENEQAGSSQVGLSLHLKNLHFARSLSIALP